MSRRPSSPVPRSLRLVQQHGLRVAVLKARSPSCGNTRNYDGHFSGT